MTSATRSSGMMLSPTARCSTNTPGMGANSNSAAARSVAAQRAGGRAGAGPSMAPASTRAASSASASAAASAWLTSASPRSSTVTAQQASGTGCPGKRVCKSSQGPLHASSNGCPPDSDASSSARAPSSAASGPTRSASGVRV